jgi:hypothetical protein
MKQNVVITKRQQPRRKAVRESALRPNMMMLDRNLVVRLAEEHHLAITIRPDGLIIGLPEDLAALRRMLEVVL